MKSSFFFPFISGPTSAFDRFVGKPSNTSGLVSPAYSIVKIPDLNHKCESPLICSINICVFCQSSFFPLWKLSRIYQIIQVLKIPVVTKEATYRFLHDYLWPIITGNLCKVAQEAFFSMKNLLNSSSLQNENTQMS